MTDITTLGIGVDSSGVVKATDAFKEFVKQGSGAASATTDFESSMRKAVVEGGLLERAISNLVTQTRLAIEGFIRLGFEIGRYQDLANISMADPAGLASLRTAADTSGIALQTLITYINQMQQRLAIAGNESKGAIRALEAINVNVKEFRELKPEEQLRTVAQHMARYADTNDKVVLSQEMFGRSGAVLLDVLKELGSETERYNLLTNEQIAYADNLADSITRSRSQMKQMAESLAFNLLPAIDALTTGLRNAIAEMMGAGNEAQRLKANEGVREFAFRAAEAISYLIDGGQILGRVFQGVAATISTAIAQIVLMKEGNFQAALEAGKSWWEDMKELTTTPLDFGEKIRDAIKDARKAFEEGRALIGDDDRTRLKFSPVIDADMEKAKEQFADIKSAIEAQIEASVRFVESQGRVTRAQELTAETYRRISEMKKTLSDRQMQEIDELLAIFDLREQEQEQLKETLRWMEESGRENQRMLEQQQDRLSILEQDRIATEEQLKQFGLSRDALEKLEIARIRESAAALRSKKLTDDWIPAARQYNELLERQAEELEAIATAREGLNEKERRARESMDAGATRAIDNYLKQIQEVGIEAERSIGGMLQDVEDGLTQLFTTGEIDTKRFINMMIAEFWRLSIVRPMLQGLFQGPGGSSEGSLFMTGISSMIGMLGGGLTVDPNGLGINPNNIPLPTRGGAASGGDVSPWSVTRVNERGFEMLSVGGEDYLLMGNNGGKVTPNDKIGGSQINLVSSPQISIDSRSDTAQIAALVQQAVAESNKALIDQMRAQGVLS